MEPPIKFNAQKIQAMKNYKRAKFAYSLALYSLTSIITCLFFSSPFWFPSITNHFLLSSFPAIISFCLNAKCLFVLGNLIVIILIGDSKLKQPSSLSSSSSSSSTSDVYDEYVTRRHHRQVIQGSVKTLNINVEEKINHHEENKKEIKFDSMPMAGEEKKKGMRSSKSGVWSESEAVKMEKAKGEREKKGSKTSGNEERKMGMRNSRSAVWGESEKGKEEKLKMGMRSCRSEIWNESEIVLRLGRTQVGREEEQQQLYVLNRRVEDFIARVNKQRLLESN